MATAGSIMIYLGANTTGIASAGRKMRTFERGIMASSQRMSSSLSSLGRSFSALTIPIGLVGVAATNMFTEFEFNLAKVEGLVGVAGNVVDRWARDLQSMAPRVAQTPKELSEALYFVTTSGNITATTLESVEKASLAASAGMGKAADIAKLAEAAMNNWGRANLSVDETMDVITMTVRKGTKEASDMIAGLSRVFPVAARLNVSFADVGAAYAGITRTGTTASTAATQLTRVFTTMIQQSDAAVPALNRMETSWDELHQILSQEGTLAFLMRLKEMLDEYGEIEMGEVFRNIRALIPVLDLLGENFEQIVGIFADFEGRAGVFNSFIATMSDTFKFKFNQVVAQASVSLNELGRSIAEALLPLFQDLVDWLTRATEWFTALDSAQKENVIRIAGIIALLGPLTVAFNVLFTAIRSVAVLVATLGTSFIGAAALIVTGMLAIGNAAKTLKELIEINPDYLAQQWRILVKKIELAFQGLRFKLSLMFMGTLLEDFFPLDDVLKRTTELELEIAAIHAEIYADTEGKSFVDGFVENSIQSLQRLKEKVMSVFASLGIKMPNLPELGTPSAGTIGESPLGHLPAPASATGLIADPMVALEKQLSYYVDLTREFKGMENELSKLNSDYETFGSAVDYSNEKIQILADGIRRIREKGGIVSDADIEKIREYAHEMQRLALMEQTNQILADSFVSLAAAVGQSFIDMKSGLTSIVDIVLSAAQQIIGAFLAVAAAAIIKGETSRFGIFGLALAAVGIGMLSALWQSAKNDMKGVASLSNGGIIPPGYSGDRFPAMLDSNEAVIPLDELWSRLEGNSLGGGQVVFHIDGKQLVGVLEEQGKLYSAF